VPAVRGIAFLLLTSVAGALGSAPAASVQATVGLVAAETPEITASLAAGARLALADWGRRTGMRWTLETSEPASAWAAASGPAIEMALDRGAVALIAPPDRATAHLLAQLGTRAHVPVVSTAEASTVTATGSFWVVAVAPHAEPSPEFVHAYRGAEGRDPDRWAVLGYDAAAAVAEAVRRVGLDRHAVMTVWRDGFEVVGSGGAFGFDALGRRRR
jgi:hypothetical protein